MERQLLDRRGNPPSPRLDLQDPRALDEVELPVPPLPWEVLRCAYLPERDSSGLLRARLPEPRLDVANLVGVVPDQVLDRARVWELRPEVDDQAGNSLVED